VELAPNDDGSVYATWTNGEILVRLPVGRKEDWQSDLAYVAIPCDANVPKFDSCCSTLTLQNDMIRVKSGAVECTILAVDQQQFPAWDQVIPKSKGPGGFVAPSHFSLSLDYLGAFAQLAKKLKIENAPVFQTTGVYEPWRIEIGDLLCVIMPIMLDKDLRNPIDSSVKSMQNELEGSVTP
jgi:hypothetical protein